MKGQFNLTLKNRIGGENVTFYRLGHRLDDHLGPVEFG